MESSEHQHGARLHRNLYRFGSKKLSGPESWRESLNIYLLSFPDSRLNPLNGFDFYFDMA